MTPARALGILACIAFTCQAQAEPELAAAPAGKHIGESAKVCGVVASAKHAARSKGGPTFLNFDEAYPNQTFTALIWEESRRHFSSPPENLRGRSLCVTGRISSYRGRAEIVVIDPAQVEAR